MEVEKMNYIKLAKKLIKKGIKTADAVLIVKEIVNKKLLEKKFTIEIVNDPAEFNPSCGIKGEQHSWAGADVEERIITIILGDVTLGSFRKMAYSKNGGAWEEDDRNFEEGSDYTLQQMQCVMEQRIINNNYNNNDEESEVYNLIVYIPMKKTKIVAFIEKIRRGYHIVKVFKSSDEELLSEEIFEYTNIKMARKKLVELKKKHRLIECNYPNYITTIKTSRKKLKELKKKHGLLGCNYPNYITTFECEE